MNKKEESIKIAIVQIKPYKGNIDLNITKHLKYIDQAIEEQADLIVFSELSLSGYEPSLARNLALAIDDHRLAVFQEKSDTGNCTICIGLPSRDKQDIQISMLIFQPKKETRAYAKQLLHEDEKSIFTAGNRDFFFTIKNSIFVPAICYESLQPEHAEKAAQQGANFYLVSVAKSREGLDKAYQHYPTIARKYGMSILMSNAVGFCDNFLSAGGSAVWNQEGQCIGQLNHGEEGVYFWTSFPSS